MYSICMLETVTSMGAADRACPPRYRDVEPPGEFVDTVYVAYSGCAYCAHCVWEKCVLR